MPNTTTATWPSLSAGQVARASDVEAKFDWSEFHLWPHAAGSFTSNTFDLGNSTTAYWRTLWAFSINATTTAQGVAIGTTTVANNSSTALEIAGTRSLLLPRLSTVQRNNLTAAEGMVIYNSTSVQFQMYQNGAWTAMGGGASIGAVAKVRVSTTAATTQTAVSIGTGVSGRLKYLSGYGTSASSPIVHTILDSVTSGDYTVTNATSGTGGFVAPNYLDSATELVHTTTVQAFDEYFRDQLRVYFRSSAGNEVNVNVVYERSA